MERAVPVRLLRSRPGRRPHPLPAPLLVLLAPRGLHHDPARHGRDQRARDLLLAEARVRLLLHRHVVSLAIAVLELPGLGPPHVRVRAQSVYAAMIFSRSQLPGGHPLGDQGLQLDGHPLPGLDLLADPDALRPRASSASSPSAGSPVSSWPPWASTSTSPTPTSSWPTSTTSWSAARSWATWAGSTSGGRRSRAGSIPSGGPGSPPS